MNIKDNDLVLEVGSGNRPYPRSDVLLDKFIEDHNQREGGLDLVIDRPFVVGDVQALPFADKSFDYIIASHIIEHSQSPAGLLNELCRVGKRGYIETPSPARERFFDWPFHRWYVYQDKKKIIIVKKTKRSKKHFFKKLSGLEDSLGNMQFEWQGKINYQIIDKEPVGFLAGLDKQLNSWLAENRRSKPQFSRTLKTKLFNLKIRVLNFWSRLKRRKINLFSLLVCPACRKKLTIKTEILKCQVCGRKFYFVKHNQWSIPVLLL